jgi:hypothetical protein
MSEPSKRKLAITTAIAFVIAMVILFTIVLPAEYGFDPLGTGEKLGLTAMSRVQVAPVELPRGDAALKPIANGPLNQYGVPFKTDAITFTLGPYDYIEYKYALQEGAQMQFSWKASVPVIHDFHGERENGEATSFDKSNRQEASGAFAAPFAGIHGWYWENPGGDTISVTLKSSGYYANSTEFRSDKTTQQHTFANP